MKAAKAPQQDIDRESGDLGWLFQQCMKAIFLVANFDLPAMHFCGSVNPDLMMEGAQFHGYNER